jgi:hypothetical protein
MIYFRDTQGETYGVVVEASLSDGPDTAALVRVKDVEEVREFLIRNPDKRYYLQPARQRFPSPFQEQQRPVPPDALFCGWVRFDTATGQIVHEPDRFNV